MLLLTIGGDLRYAHLTAQAAAQSLEIAAIGLEKSPFPLPTASLEDISSAGALILPNPWRSGVQCPLADNPFQLEDVLSRASPETHLLLSDVASMPSPPPSLPITDLSADEIYVRKNAYLTAEAAMFRAYMEASVTYMDARCLIIGWGRIGKRLSALLRSAGADVAVIARREETRREATDEGLNAFPMDALPHLLPHARFIFTTPPARVLDNIHLRLIRPDALLMDLASPPFGFDLNAALALSLHAVRENGLPGRCCPESAAAAMLDAVQRALVSAPKGESACII